MKSLISMVGFLFCIEIQTIHSYVQIGDTIITLDVSQNEEANKIFRDAYTVDSLALGNLAKESVKSLWPRLQEGKKSVGNNAVGFIFNYLLKLCGEYSTQKKLNQLTRNIENFVTTTGGGKKKDTRQSGAIEVKEGPPPKNGKFFLAKKLSTNNNREIEAIFRKYDESKKEAEEKRKQADEAKRRAGENQRGPGARGGNQQRSTNVEVAPTSNGQGQSKSAKRRARKQANTAAAATATAPASATPTTSGMVRVDSSPKNAAPSCGSGRFAQLAEPSSDSESEIIEAESPDEAMQKFIRLQEEAMQKALESQKSAFEQQAKEMQEAMEKEMKDAGGSGGKVKMIVRQSPVVTKTFTTGGKISSDWV